VLQFKENVKSNHQASVLASWEKAIKEANDLTTLKAAEPKVKKLLQEIGTEVAAPYIENIKDINKVVQEYNKVVEDIIKTSKGTLHATPERVIDLNTVKSFAFESRLREWITVKVQFFAGLYLNNYEFYIKAEDVAEDTIESSLRDKLDEVKKVYDNKYVKYIQDLQSHTKDLEKQKQELLVKIERGKKAQSDVNAGKPVDPDFIAEILAIFKNGKSEADKEFAS
jgi:tetrahydromethanopterin S-methyltransferase subunit A